MRKSKAYPVALGGLLAAAAVVIMCFVGIIPLATFVCPVLCCMICGVVLTLCGKRIAWAWYVAVALLSLILAPDKESALVFACFGFYPIIKPKLDKLPLPWLWKTLLFNGIIVLVYACLLRLLGMDALAQEYQALETGGLVLILLLGNLVFFLTDLVLGKRFWKHG